MRLAGHQELSFSRPSVSSSCSLFNGEVATVNVSTTNDLVIHRIESSAPSTFHHQRSIKAHPPTPSPPPSSPSYSNQSSLQPRQHPPPRKSSEEIDLDLMNQIKDCRNWRDMSRLVFNSPSSSSSSSSFANDHWNHVHCSAALSHLAKTLSPPKQLSNRSSSNLSYNVSWLVDSGLIDSFWEVEELLATLCVTLASRMSACKPRQVANCSWALSKIHSTLLKPYSELQGSRWRIEKSQSHGWEEGSMPEALNRNSSDLDHDYHHSRVEGILMATMKALVARSYRMLLKHHRSSSPSSTSSFNPQELSSLIYSVASLLNSPTSSSPSSSSSSSLSNSPSLSLPPGWIEKWIDAASQPAIRKNLSPQSIANIAWAFTQLATTTSSFSCHEPPANSEQDFSAVELPEQQPWIVMAREWLLAQCSMVDNEGGGEGEVGTPQPLKDKEATKRLPLSASDTPSLAVLSWSLARMEVLPSNAWLLCFFNATQARLAHMTSRDLANVAWAAAYWSRRAMKASRSSSSSTPSSVLASPSGPGSSCWAVPLASSNHCETVNDGSPAGSIEDQLQGEKPRRAPPSLLPIPSNRIHNDSLSTRQQQQQQQQRNQLSSATAATAAPSRWGDVISTRQKERNTVEQRRKRLFRSRDESMGSMSDVEDFSYDWNAALASTMAPNKAGREAGSQTSTPLYSPSPPSLSSSSFSSIDDDFNFNVRPGFNQLRELRNEHDAPQAMDPTTQALHEVFSYWKEELLNQFEIRAINTSRLLHDPSFTLSPASPSHHSPLSPPSSSSSSSFHSRNIQLLSTRGVGEGGGIAVNTHGYSILSSPYDTRPEWWQLDTLSFSSLCSSLETLKLSLIHSLVKLPAKPSNVSSFHSSNSRIASSSSAAYQTAEKGRRSKRIERFQSSESSSENPPSSSSSSSSTRGPHAHRGNEDGKEKPHASEPPLISFASWLLEASLRNSSWVGSRGLVSVSSLLALSIASNSQLRSKDNDKEGMEGRKGRKSVAHEFVCPGRLHALIWAAAGSKPRLRPNGSSASFLPRKSSSLSSSASASSSFSTTSSPSSSLNLASRHARPTSSDASLAASRLLRLLRKLNENTLPAPAQLNGSPSSQQPIGAHTALKLFRLSTSLAVSQSTLHSPFELQSLTSALIDGAKLRLRIPPTRLAAILSVLHASLARDKAKDMAGSTTCSVLRVGGEIELSRSIVVLCLSSVSSRMVKPGLSKVSTQSLLRLTSSSWLLLHRLYSTSDLAASSLASSPILVKDAVMLLWSLASINSLSQRLNQINEGPRASLRYARPRFGKDDGSSSSTPLFNQPMLSRRMHFPPLSHHHSKQEPKGSTTIRVDSKSEEVIARLLSYLGLPRPSSSFSSNPPSSSLSFSRTEPYASFTSALSFMGPEELSMVLWTISHIYVSSPPSSSCSAPIILPSKVLAGLRERSRSLLPDLNPGLLVSVLCFLSRSLQGDLNAKAGGLEKIKTDKKESRRWATFLDDLDVELAWRQSQDLNVNHEERLMQCIRVRMKLGRLIDLLLNIN